MPCWVRMRGRCDSRRLLRNPAAFARKAESGCMSWLGFNLGIGPPYHIWYFLWYNRTYRHGKFSLSAHGSTKVMAASSSRRAPSVQTTGRHRGPISAGVRRRPAHAKWFCPPATSSVFRQSRMVPYTKDRLAVDCRHGDLGLSLAKGGTAKGVAPLMDVCDHTPDGT